MLPHRRPIAVLRSSVQNYSSLGIASFLLPSNSRSKEALQFSQEFQDFNAMVNILRYPLKPNLLVKMAVAF